MKSSKKKLYSSKVSRDVVHDLLDWPAVVSFFKEVGPGHLTVEVKKNRSSITIKQKFQ